MNHKLLSIPFVISGILILALFWLAGAARAEPKVGETPLNELGNAYEVNADEQGLVWVSDNGAGEVRAYNPATNVYTTYLNMGAPSDARRGAEGKVWWVDQEKSQLGQLTPGSNTMTRWDIPGTTLYGTAIDSANNIWITDYFQPSFYRFDPEASQVCTYTFAKVGASDYILAHEGGIWLSDWVKNAIYRFDTHTNLLKSWQLPFDARQVGLAIDNQGNFWWADQDRNELARLEPVLNRLTVYDTPTGGTPEMITISSGDQIWYTDVSSQLVGKLDSFQASGTSQTLIVSEQSLDPSCAVISPVGTGTVSTISGVAEWTSTTYTTTYDSGGWLIRQLPPDAYPWGIAASNGQVWLVDNGRQVLARIRNDLSLSACKLADGDGNLNTTGDQLPVEGWNIHLIADGVPVEPGQLSNPDGCTSWSNLEPRVSYGVQEDVLSTWTPLGPISHTFGVLTPGEAYSHTFINMNMSTNVTACTLTDADGNPSTTGDQAPLPGQTVYLHLDGVRQEPGQVTGADGCQTWSDLAPDHAYGVEQASLPNYALLGEATHDFGVLAPGAAVSHNFVNARGVTVQACSLADADGDPLTTSDQAPLPGQTIYLLMEGERQESGQFTGADGCLAWSDLAPNHTYGVEQILSPGWEALTLSTYTFDLALPGGTFQGTFINRRISLKLFVPLIFH